MPAGEFFLAGCVLHVYALLSEADVLERVLPFGLFLLIGQLVATEPTFACLCMPLEFCAILACVVRLRPAPSAEALITGSAFHSMLGHMDGGSRRYDLPLIVFGVVVDLAGLDLHDISTRTRDQILVLIHEGLEMKFVDLFELFGRQIILQFLVLKRLVALGAIQEFLGHEHLERRLLEALQMDLVEAL